MVLGWLLVACFVGSFVAQIDTDVAQSVPQVQLNFVHHLGLVRHTRLKALVCILRNFDLWDIL